MGKIFIFFAVFIFATLVTMLYLCSTYGDVYVVGHLLNQKTLLFIKNTHGTKN